jgi:hypothetical protein
MIIVNSYEAHMRNNIFEPNDHHLNKLLLSDLKLKIILR